MIEVTTLRRIDVVGKESHNGPVEVQDIQPATMAVVMQVPILVVRCLCDRDHGLVGIIQQHDLAAVTGVHAIDAMMDPV